MSDQKSPERLMLEAVKFGQELRREPPGTKTLAKAWKQWDALAAEAIAALAHRLQPLTDEQKEEIKKIGNGLGVVLGMEVHEEETERWVTKWGTKTGLGLVLILERFINHVNGNFANADDQNQSLAAECRSLEARAQKLFQRARMRAVQQKKRELNQREFYESQKEKEDRNG